MNGTEPSVSIYAIFFWGIVTFSFIVIVHELGHFLTARAFGVRVHEFVVGLPGPMLRFKTRITTFGVTVIPFGGYVRIAGMEPGKEDPLLEEAFTLALQRDVIDPSVLAQELNIGIGRARAILTTLADWGGIESVDADSHRYRSSVDDAQATDPPSLFQRMRNATFRGKKTWQRITILGTGVLFNLLFAILTFSVVLSVWGYYEPSTTIEQAMPGTPAEEIGLTTGDRVVALDGQAVHGWADILSAIDAHRIGDAVVVSVVRDDLTLDFTATLGESAEGRPYLGIETRMENVRLPFLAAVKESVRWTGLVFVALGNLFRPDRFAGTIEDARGIVGVSVEAARAAQRGPVDYAWMVALLSLSLGALNIFPIPPLDGGRIVFEIVEKVRGRPLSREVYLGATAVGALLILSLLAYLVYADIIHYVFGG